MHYNKLVRDRTAARLAQRGRQARTRQLAPDEFPAALRAKLLEEAAECAAAQSPQDIAEECADVLEVIAALAAVSGISWDEVTAMREQKARRRGTFRERILLIEAD